jgi:Icc-related predicted phosphoesterase
MKAYVCSDLHCEFHEDGGKKLITQILPGAPIAIVAGDLAVGEGLRPALKLLADKYRQVVYIAGNHDYYNSSREGIEAIRQSMNLPNVHWLEDEVVQIEGLRFVGCTLWFGWHRSDLELQITDFQVIAGIRRWVHEKNQKSLEFLRKNVKADSIVVTHHLPSNRSIVPRYQGSPLNCFFACPEAEEILLEKAPRLWIHGHTHDSLDYHLGQTRVICNPFGYAGVEMNPSFLAEKLMLDL